MYDVLRVSRDDSHATPHSPSVPVGAVGSRRFSEVSSFSPPVPCNPLGNSGAWIVETTDSATAHAIQRRARGVEDVSLPYPSMMSCTHLVTLRSPSMMYTSGGQPLDDSQRRSGPQREPHGDLLCCQPMDEDTVRQEEERRAQRHRQHLRLAQCEASLRSHHVPLIPFCTRGVFHGERLPTNEQAAAYRRQQRVLANDGSFVMGGSFRPTDSQYNYGCGVGSGTEMWNTSLYLPPQARLVQMHPEEIMDVYDYKSAHHDAIAHNLLTGEPPSGFCGGAHYGDAVRPMRAKAALVNVVRRDPMRLEGHSAVLYQNVCYVFGGVDQERRTLLNQTFAVNVHEMLSSVSSTVSLVERRCGGAVPSPRCFHACALRGSTMFVCGGLTEPTAGSERTSVRDEEDGNHAARRDKEAYFTEAGLLDSRHGNGSPQRSDSSRYGPNSAARSRHGTAFPRVGPSPLVMELFALQLDQMMWRMVELPYLSPTARIAPHPGLRCHSTLTTTSGGALLFVGGFPCAMGGGGGFVPGPNYDDPQVFEVPPTLTHCFPHRAPGTAVASNVDDGAAPQGTLWGHSTVYSHGVLVIFGGVEGIGSEASDTDSLRVYDISRQRWRGSSFPYGPQARALHTACIFGDQVVVFGGFAGYQQFDDAWSFSLSEGFWEHMHTTGSVHPAPRSGHAAVAANRLLLVLGGLAEADEEFDDETDDDEDHRHARPSKRGPTTLPGRGVPGPSVHPSPIGEASAPSRVARHLRGGLLYIFDIDCGLWIRKNLEVVPQLEAPTDYQRERQLLLKALDLGEPELPPPTLPSTSRTTHAVPLLPPSGSVRPEEIERDRIPPVDVSRLLPRSPTPQPETDPRVPHFQGGATRRRATEPTVTRLHLSGGVGATEPSRREGTPQVGSERGTLHHTVVGPATQVESGGSSAEPPRSAISDLLKAARRGATQGAVKESDAPPYEYPTPSGAWGARDTGADPYAPHPSHVDARRPSYIHSGDYPGRARLS